MCTLHAHLASLLTVDSVDSVVLPLSTWPEVDHCSMSAVNSEGGLCGTCEGLSPHCACKHPLANDP